MQWKAKLRRARWLLLLLLLVAAVTATVAVLLWRRLSQDEAKSFANLNDNVCGNVVRQIELYFAQRIALLRTFGFMLSETPTSKTCPPSALSNRVLPLFAWAPAVNSSAVPAFLRSHNLSCIKRPEANLTLGFTLSSDQPRTTLPCYPKSMQKTGVVMFPVVKICGGNAASISELRGTDVAAIPEIADAIARDIQDPYKTSLAEPFITSNILVEMQSLYRGGGLPDSVVERQLALVGVLLSYVNASQLLSRLWLPQYDGVAVSLEWSGLPNSLVIAGWNVRANRKLSSTVSVMAVAHQNQPLHVRCNAYADWLESSRTPIPWLITSIVAASGVLIAILIYLVWSNRQGRMEVAAAFDGHRKFVAFVIHELRSPLQAVMTFSDFAKQRLKLESGAVPDGLKNLESLPSLSECIDAIHPSCQAILSIVNDVLDISKIAEGKLLIENVPFMLDSIASMFQLVYEPLAKQKGLSFTVKVDPVLQGTAFKGDPNRIAQVLRNLLSNAMKFTSTGAVQLSVVAESPFEQRQFAASHKITRPLSEWTLVSISVRDTGQGISSDSLQRLFQPYEQASSATARMFGGTGLGLHIVKNMVRCMNGTVSVVSELGAGSTFTILLPCGKASPAETAAALQSSPLTFAPGAEGTECASNTAASTPAITAAAIGVPTAGSAVTEIKAG